MVELTCLWLPILLSAVAIFFLSFIMWMVMPHHRKDWGKMPDEGAARAALGDIPAGQYMFPFFGSQQEMKDPEYVKSREAGPSGLLIVMPRGPVKMGKYLLQSFLYNVVICVVVAYVATIGLRGNSDCTDVFRLTATVAFLGCAGALGWNAIWYHYSWSSTLKWMFDGLVYGIATGLIFSVLWPACGGGWDAEAAAEAVKLEMTVDAAGVPLETEFHIDPAAVPEAVRKAMDAKHPGGAYIGAEKEWSGGRLYFELARQVGGLEVESMFEPDGTLFNEEIQVAAGDVPQGVKDAIAGGWPNGQVNAWEKILDGAGTLLEYHVKLQDGGRALKIVVSTGGKLMAGYREVPSEIEVPIELPK